MYDYSYSLFFMYSIHVSFKIPVVMPYGLVKNVTILLQNI